MSGDDLFTVVSEVYRNERRSKVLTKLPINFYHKAEEYLATQREEYSQAILIPSNPKTMMLQDQIKKVEKRLKHIYEIRERKIALSALDRMGGASALEHMTRKDKELYELLVTALKSFREGVEPPAVPERPKAARVEPIPAPQPVIKEAQAQIMEQEPEIEQMPPREDERPSAKEPKDESIVVHVLEDIPSFVGAEHTYDLKKDDMVTLPSQFANLLSSNGKVRIVDG